LLEKNLKKLKKKKIIFG